MSHTRTAIAILSLATITVPVLHAGAEVADQESLYITVETTSTTIPESTTVVEQAREILDSQRPWFADYPATTEVADNMVFAQTEDQVAQVERALDVYASAGLDLPHIEFWMHDTTAGCVADDGGLRAGYLLGGRGVWTIFMCGSDFTLLHELGHVWDNHVMTDDKRAEFLTLRKADAWSGVEWSRAGGEHLADVLAWGLSGGEVRPSRTLPNDDASLAQAFETATGSTPQNLEV